MPGEEIAPLGGNNTGDGAVIKQLHGGIHANRGHLGNVTKQGRNLQPRSVIQNADRSLDAEDEQQAHKEGLPLEERSKEPEHRAHKEQAEAYFQKGLSPGRHKVVNIRGHHIALKEVNHQAIDEGEHCDLDEESLHDKRIFGKHNLDNGYRLREMQNLAFPFEAAIDEAIRKDYGCHDPNHTHKYGQGIHRAIEHD